MKKSLPIFFIILALLISNCGHNEQGIDNLEIEALTTHDLNQEEPITSPELQKENENRLEKITEKHSIQNISKHRYKDNKTLLHLAAIQGDHLMIKHLLKNHNIDINVQDTDGNTALHYAVINLHPSCVLPLIRAGADKYIHNNSNEAPISIAKRIENGSKEDSDEKIKASCISSLLLAKYEDEFFKF